MALTIFTKKFKKVFESFSTARDRNPDTLWLCQNSYWKWWSSSWIYPLKMVMFHSYVSLPEGILFWQSKQLINDSSSPQWCKKSCLLVQNHVKNHEKSSRNLAPAPPNKVNLWENWRPDSDFGTFCHHGTKCCTRLSSSQRPPCTGEVHPGAHFIQRSNGTGVWGRGWGPGCQSWGSESEGLTCPYANHGAGRFANIYPNKITQFCR